MIDALIMQRDFFRKSRYFAKMGLKDMASLQARLSKDLVSFQYRLSLMPEAVVYLFSTIVHSHCLKLWQLCKVSRTLQFKRFLMLMFVLRESNLNPLLILIKYSLIYSFPRLGFHEANKYIFIGLTLCLQDYNSGYFQGLHSRQGRCHPSDDDNAQHITLLWGFMVNFPFFFSFFLFSDVSSWYKQRRSYISKYIILRF